MFIKLIRPDIVIGTRVYAKGSVVEVDDTRGKSEVEAKNAVVDSGPASEPEPEDEKPKGRK